MREELWSGFVNLRARNLQYPYIYHDQLISHTKKKSNGNHIFVVQMIYLESNDLVWFSRKHQILVSFIKRLDPLAMKRKVKN